MADQEYNLLYNVRGNARPEIDALAESLLNLEAIIDRLGPKFAEFGKTVGPTMRAAAKASKDFGDSVGSAGERAAKTAAAAASAASAVSSLSTALVTVRPATAAVTSLARELATVRPAAIKAAEGVSGFAMICSAATVKIGGTELAVRQLGRALAALSAMMNAVGGAGGRAGDSIKQLGRSAGDTLPAVINSGRGMAVYAQETKAAAEHTERLRDRVQDTEAGLVKFLAVQQGLRVARMILNEYIDASKQLEDTWKKLADDAIAFRKASRELASLKGESGPNNKVIADTLDVALASRMDADQARKAMAAYENIGPTVRERGHYKPTQGTPEELEKEILAETGKTATRLQIDPAAAFEAMGMAALRHTFTTKEEAMEQLGGALEGIQLGKLNYTLGVKALGKASAKLVDPKEEEAAEAKAEGATTQEKGTLPGRVQSYAEAGHYLGVLSYGTSSADQASHRMIQISRALNPDQSKEKAQEALKDAGLTPKMSDPEKLITLNKYMKAQKVQDRLGWLSEHKIGTEATREALVAAMKEAPVLEERLKKLRGGHAKLETGTRTIAQNASFMGEDQSARASTVEATGSVQKELEGLQQEEFRVAKQAALVRYQQQEPTEFRGILRGFANAVTSPLSYIRGGVGGEESEAEIHEKYGAITVLKQEAKKVGIDLLKEYPGVYSSSLTERGVNFAKASAAVRARGGDPLAMGELTETSRKQIQAIRPQPRPPVPKPIPEPLKAAELPVRPALPGESPAGMAGPPEAAPAAPAVAPGVPTAAAAPGAVPAGMPGEAPQAGGAPVQVATAANAPVGAQPPPANGALPAGQPQPGVPEGKIPAGQPPAAGGAKPATPGAIPPVTMFGGSGASDPSLLAANREQVSLLRDIRSAVTRQQSGVGAVHRGPIPTDGGDFGPIRS